MFYCQKATLSLGRVFQSSVCVPRHGSHGAPRLCEPPPCGSLLPSSLPPCALPPCALPLWALLPSCAPCAQVRLQSSSRVFRGARGGRGGRRCGGHDGSRRPHEEVQQDQDA